MLTISIIPNKLIQEVLTVGMQNGRDIACSL